MLMAFPSAALSTVGYEIFGGNACGHARVAVVATGTVGKSAAAAKTRLYQFIVYLAVNQIIRYCHLRARQSFQEIAARIRLCRVVFQCRCCFILLLHRQNAIFCLVREQPRVRAIAD